MSCLQSMCVQECIGLFDNRTRLVEVRVQCGSLLSIGANYQCTLRRSNPNTIPFIALFHLKQ
jgi:hypothetical protein